MVFDVDGTREAARQRALPQIEELPSAFRRLDDVCAPGYRGRQQRPSRPYSHRHQSSPQFPMVDDKWNLENSHLSPVMWI